MFPVNVDSAKTALVEAFAVNPPVVVPVDAGCTTGVAFQNPIFCVVPVPILLPVVVPKTLSNPSADVNAVAVKERVEAVVEL